MSCNHCVMRIMNALKPLPGMGNITVDIDKKTVEITGEPDIQAVTRAIEQAGYTIES
ncbi:MAG: cation transporter [Spirochaetes bacterium]|nr:cation transporter [Spirochaetota bacterium]